MGLWASSVYEAMGDARLRELVILAVAEVTDCASVWQAHVPLARESARETMAISTGDFQGFSPGERAALSHASDHATTSVTDETHARVAEQFDDSDLVTISTLARV